MVDRDSGDRKEPTMKLDDIRQRCEEAYNWAINQNYPSVAAQYAKTLAQAVDELSAEVEQGQERDKRLMREVCKLACESVEREKKLAKLEAEVEHAIAATRWIPVSERYPEEAGSYLCWFVDEFYGVYDWCGQHGLWDAVTHWMLLPSEPEGE